MRDDSGTHMLVDAFGYGVNDVIRIARNAFTVCYAEPELKVRLMEEFDEWASRVQLGNEEDIK